MRAANERRRRRSSHPHEALSLQLAYVREEAGLDALVLANAEGLLIAHAGDPHLCEELAALAPIANGNGKLPMDTPLEGSYLQVRPVSWSGLPLYLASCSESLADTVSARITTWLEHTGAGVQRILAA